MVNDPQFAAGAAVILLVPIILIAVAAAMAIFGAGFVLGWLF